MTVSKNNLGGLALLLFDEVAVEADDDAIEEDVGDMTTGVV